MASSALAGWHHFPPPPDPPAGPSSRFTYSPFALVGVMHDLGLPEYQMAAERTLWGMDAANQGMETLVYLTPPDTLLLAGYKLTAGEDLMGRRLTTGQMVFEAINVGLVLTPVILASLSDLANWVRTADNVVNGGASVARKGGLLDMIGSANLPYRTKVTTGVKASRFFATRTGYQQVIKHSPITNWLQTMGWQSHHWAIPRSRGLAGSEGLRRITEAGWNLIPLPAQWNRAISNGGLGFNGTRALVGASPVIVFYGGYELGSFVSDVGWWLMEGEWPNE